MTPGWVLRALSMVAGLAFLASLSVDAQPPKDSHRIGYLGISPLSAPNATKDLAAFRQGLREFGWIDGKNVTIEYRHSSEGSRERFSPLAAELVGLKVDVIVAVATPATLAARQATTTIPIVGIVLSDPVGQGLAASLMRPGGNVTGLASLFPELAAKRLELLRETLPGLSRVAILWNATNPGNAVQIDETRVAARALGLQLQSVELRSPDDFTGAFAAITRMRPGALVTLADPLVFTHRAQIAAFAAKNRLPAIHPFSASVEAGGLMSYHLDAPQIYRRAAIYVDKIFRGARPAELPIEQPTKFEFVINMKAARALGLAIPKAVLLRADRLVE